jgi:hypothetical protein
VAELESLVAGLRNRPVRLVFRHPKQGANSTAARILNRRYGLYEQGISSASDCLIKWEQVQIVLTLLVDVT